MGLVQRCASGLSHPKLAVTEQLLREHFATHGADTRAMVFMTYRNAVNELLERLRNVEGVKVRPKPSDAAEAARSCAALLVAACGCPVCTAARRRPRATRTERQCDARPTP